MERFTSSIDVMGMPDSLGNYHLPSVGFSQHVNISKANTHSSHPNFKHLTGLVSEAVLEVVCVSVLGYIVARRGMFDGNAQKMVANLNIMIFTPCLIFSKLAKQLTSEKLIELGIIPLILLAQTAISFICAAIVTRLFRIKKKPQRNFVTAMAVFGNSNSLPLSLVISLSQTISGLHWDKIPGDNDNEVAARGILYLLIFSQLGQALRWSWGMNSLLKPESEYTPAERGEIPRDDEEREPYTDNTDEPTRVSSVDGRSDDATNSEDTVVTQGVTDGKSRASSVHKSASNSSSSSDPDQRLLRRNEDGNVVVGDDVVGAENERRHALTRTVTSASQISFVTKAGNRVSTSINKASARAGKAFSRTANKAFRSLPLSLQKTLSVAGRWIKFVALRIYACLNIPLASIIFSVVVATIPKLQAFFFTPGTFVNNTLTAAVEQTGGVAVPLILVVLGANLAKNTLPDEGYETTEYRREKRNMLIASLICRLVLPTLVMAPLLAVTARFVPVSILDDPIFIIVCFLLAGAPSALQLAQMCQVNNLYISVVSRLLMHSYVLWIFPSTLVLVMLALEVVEWAAQA